MKEITLWIPAIERPSWQAAESWWNLEAPRGTKLKLLRSGANDIKVSWNDAILQHLATDREWILSVHSDVVVAPETLTRLLSWKKPLVSALVFMRVGPVIPHIWKKYDDDGRMVMRINDTREWFYKHREYIRYGPFVMKPRPRDALAPIDFTSTSCALIHRSVLEAMQPIVNGVWFEWDDVHKGGGEDRKFFQNAALAGFPAYVDRSCVAGHVAGDYMTSPYDFIAWDAIAEYKDTGEMIESKKKKLNGNSTG